MTIRPATNADQSEIQNLVFAILRSYGLAPSLETTDSDLTDLESFYGGPNDRFDVLVSEDGSIVGTVALHETDLGEAELRKMYLSASCRGKGLGQRLLDHILEKARESGLKTVWLETAPVLKEACRLYEANGFEASSCAAPSDRCETVMRLELNRLREK